MIRTKTSGLKDLSRRKKILLTALVALALLTAGGYFLVGRPAQALYQQVKLAKPHLANLKTGLITQNLPQIQADVAELDQIRAQSAEIYQQFGWLEVIPRVGNYYRDGQHVFRAGEQGIEAAQIMVTALDPFKDLLGTVGISGFIGLAVTWAIADSGLQLPFTDTINTALAFIIGYAGGDFIENLYKLLLKKPELFKESNLQGA